MAWAKPQWLNPWNLSPQEERVVHLYSIEGTYKGVAARMGLSYHTINSTMKGCRRKMGTKTITRCAVLYALWRQTVLGPSAEIEALINQMKERE